MNEQENATNANVAEPEVIEEGTAPEAVADDQSADQNEEGSADQNDEKPTDQEWTPDYKFKVRDNEHEFDDVIKPFVNKDNHSKIKELYEKAYGLDYTKKRLDQYDSQFAEMTPKVQRLEQQDQLINQLDSMLAKNDFTSFQKTLKINDDLILKRAAEILKLQELPQDERARLEQHENAQTQLYTLEQQNQMYQNMMLEQVRQAKVSQVDQLLTSPQIANLVNDFDTRVGKPGAFKERVFDYGQRIYVTEGRDISPQEAVQGFLQFAGINPSQVAATTQPATQQSTPGAMKETLPNITSSGKAPTGKTVKSIEEIRQLANSLRG